MGRHGVNDGTRYAGPYARLSTEETGGPATNLTSEID